MKIKFIYTVESEINRVKDILDDREFFKRTNYEIFFPEGFSFETEVLETLKDQIEKEMEYEKIKKIKESFADRWRKNEKALNNFLEEVSYSAPKELIVIFTKYGTGGSYETPNKVTINVQYDKDFFENAVHELIHCLIQKPIILKYNVSHFEKEGLVDMIIVKNKHLRSIFPKYWYQVGSAMPTKELLKKIGWDEALFLD